MTTANPRTFSGKERENILRHKQSDYDDEFIDDEEFVDDASGDSEDLGHTTEYGKAEYWDERYSTFSPFDWLLEYTHFKEADFTKFFRKNDRFLMLGCGSARFSADMYDDGFENIFNIDLSSVVIKDEMEKNAHRENMHYEVMNVTDLTFGDETFDVVIDKSTMDCIFCCANSVQQISDMMHESWRVLKPGGLFVTLSLHEESKVLPYISVDAESMEFNWLSIESMKIPNPGYATDKEKSEFHMVIVAVKPADATEPMKTKVHATNTLTEESA